MSNYYYNYTPVPEFPKGGDERFRAILAEMLETHIRKGADYGSRGDIFANCRGSEEIDIPAWKGTFIRLLDKVKRIQNAARGAEMQNESVRDSFIDLANYAIIALILFEEEGASTTESNDSCGDCACGETQGRHC